MTLFWTELREPEEEEIDGAKTRVQQCREQKEMEKRSKMLIRQKAKELYDSLFSTKELQEQKGERRERSPTSVVRYCTDLSPISISFGATDKQTIIKSVSFFSTNMRDCINRT
jgi:hypothetical protein